MTLERPCFALYAWGGMGMSIPHIIVLSSHLLLYSFSHLFCCWKSPRCPKQRRWDWMETVFCFVLALIISVFAGRVVWPIAECCQEVVGGGGHECGAVQRGHCASELPWDGSHHACIKGAGLQPCFVMFAGKSFCPPTSKNEGPAGRCQTGKLQLHSCKCTSS